MLVGIHKQAGLTPLSEELALRDVISADTSVDHKDITPHAMVAGIMRTNVPTRACFRRLVGDVTPLFAMTVMNGCRISGSKRKIVSMLCSKLHT